MIISSLILNVSLIFTDSSRVQILFLFQDQTIKEIRDKPNSLNIVCLHKSVLTEQYLFLECGNSEKEKEDNYAKISDILLWAIFANRRDLAEICWLKGKDHLCKIYFC